MSIDTYVVQSVALATAETAIPSPLPSFGALIDWSAYVAWTECPFEFAEDAFDFTNVDENAIIIKPPARPVKTKKIRNTVGIESIGFTAYEIGGKVYDWATNASEASGVYTFSQIHTRKAMIMEFGGIGLLYFPSVEIQCDPPVGGVWTKGTQKGLIDVFGTDTIIAGYQWVQLQ